MEEKATNCLGGLIVASAASRSLASLLRATPLYYPDEYVYSSMARGVAATGLPRIQGGLIAFPAPLGPYLMSPAWLIHNVTLAYHVALVMGCVWFSLAALPAYFIGRSIGLTNTGSLLVALLTVLAPVGALSTALMTDPIAYPLFLGTVYCAIKAVISPSLRRQALLLGLMGALILERTEFLFMPVAFLAAAAITDRSARAAWQRQSLVSVSTAVFVVGALLAVMADRGLGYYGKVWAHHISPEALLTWALIDLFVLAISAGWVVVPGGMVGLGAMFRSGSTENRFFATFTAIVVGCLIAAAAYPGALEQRIHERYEFYAAPLLAAAFAWTAQHLRRGRSYSLAAYALALVAIEAPATATLQGAATDESPSILGLRFLGGGGHSSWLLMGVVLALLAALTGTGLCSFASSATLATGFLLALALAGTHGVLNFGRVLEREMETSLKTVRELHVRGGSALVTTRSGNEFRLMETLFWNPTISRVVVLGGGPAPDRLPSQAAYLSPRNGFVGRDGHPIRGPFVFGVYTAVTDSSVAFGLGAQGRVSLPATPRVIVFGVNRLTGDVRTTGTLYAAAGRTPRVVTLRLANRAGPASFTFTCGSRRSTRVITSHPANVEFVVPRESSIRCSIRFVGGKLFSRAGILFGARATRLSVR